ncbi:histidine kinase [Arcicella aurantiaca]|uniref:Histidine kinase n=1 Tax=Arcicella aurantiaca TaxID=591202 RepID=A0A316E9K4_9BACT|nr:sensor histidine kinase [Arcicella aurantiaca]PWK27438.1 histidine kinase [Arcicella aurantiaca]
MDKRRNHIIFWVGYFLLINGISICARIGTGSLTIPFFLRIFVGDVTTLSLTYLYLNILFPRFLTTKKYLWLLLVSLGSYFLIVSGIYGLFRSLQQLYPQIFSSVEFLQEFINVIYSFFRVLNITFSFWIFKKLLAELEQKKEKEKKYFTLNKHISNAELMSLKNQINPHFFYNSLNFLYAQSIPYSVKLSKSILSLADMMRYSIRDNDETNTIPLEQEIAYLERYIYLENIESQSSYQSQLIVMGNVKYRRIVPLVLQPILSSSYHFGKEVNIGISIEENQIQFVCTYTKKQEIEISDIDEFHNVLRRKMVNKYYQSLSVNYTHNTELYSIFIVILS